jgi:hypothetical protein
MPGALGGSVGASEVATISRRRFSVGTHQALTFPRGFKGSGMDAAGLSIGRRKTVISLS